MVTNFQAELAQKIGSLCDLVATSTSKQQEHLHCVEKLCHSFTGTHDKVLNDKCIIIKFYWFYLIVSLFLKLCYFFFSMVVLASHIIEFLSSLI